MHYLDWVSNVLQASQPTLRRLLGRMIVMLNRLLLLGVDVVPSTQGMRVGAAPFGKLHPSIRRGRIVETAIDYLVLAKVFLDYLLRALWLILGHNHVF